MGEEILRGRRKCPVCKEWFRLEEEGVWEHKGRFYHRKCFDENIGQAEKDMQALEQYIKKIFNVDALNIKVKKQIDTFLKAGYKIKGIEKTLYYWFEVKKESLEKANGGIGIVPYVYEEAKQYFATQERNSKMVLKNTEIDLIPKQVSIRPPLRPNKNHIPIDSL